MLHVTWTPLDDPGGGPTPGCLLITHTLGTRHRVGRPEKPDCNHNLPDGNLRGTQLGLNEIDLSRFPVLPLDDITVLPLDAVLAHLAVAECRRSNVFCRSFINYIHAHARKGSDKPSKVILLDSDSEIHFNDGYVQDLTVIRLLPPTSCFIDYKWCYRLLVLATRRHQLYDTMNWLSTLGGGYSALGDYFQHHAEQAGQLSRLQYQLAVSQGERPAMLRCQLYLALSRMQQGHLRQAKHIIRSTFRSIQDLPVPDRQLDAMCHGVWNKLRYLYHCRCEERLSSGEASL